MQNEKKKGIAEAGLTCSNTILNFGIRDDTKHWQRIRSSQA